MAAAEGKTSELGLDSRLALNDGKSIPAFGLGVYQSSPGQETANAVAAALNAGYIHVDTAAVYGNEEGVAAGIKKAGKRREDVYITSKLWLDHAGYEATKKAIAASLARLESEYIDMYLMHAPIKDKEARLGSWRAMVEAREAGKLRSIGVSNFGAHHLEHLAANSDVVPAVNQLELNPFITRDKLVAHCEAKGILLTAYSPLAKARKFDNPVLVEVAKRVDRTPAQVMVRWGLQRGFTVIPKSAKAERIKANAGVFDFALSDADMAALNALDEYFVTGWDPTKDP